MLENQNIKQNEKTDKEKTPVLTEGIEVLTKNQTAYIGPLASCFGITIPLKEGAIIAHIPPDSPKTMEYVKQLFQMIADKNARADNSDKAYIFYKAPKDIHLKAPYKPIIEAIKKALEEYDLADVHKFEYTNDLTYILVDTVKKQLIAAPLKADLSPEPGFTPGVIEY